MTSTLRKSCRCMAGRRRRRRRCCFGSDGPAPPWRARCLDPMAPPCPAPVPRQAFGSYEPRRCHARFPPPPPSADETREPVKPQTSPVMEAIWLYQFRLIVIGDSTVGKSCLIRRFTEGRFAQVSDPTVGVDFFSRLVEIEPGKRIKLQIWDTAGQERFRSITRAYYRNSVGGLLLFDIANRRSFQNVHEWLEEARSHVQPHSIVFLLVGHKCDLEAQRQVSRQEAERLAGAYGMRYVETSARDAVNVERAFTELTKDIFALVRSGDIAVQEGWEGVKSGLVPNVVHSSEEVTQSDRRCLC
ncbi:ras-related protein Rab-39B isoform X2 [Stigmatopora argus]